MSRAQTTAARPPLRALAFALGSLALPAISAAPTAAPAAESVAEGAPGPSAVGDRLRLLRVTPEGQDVEAGNQILLSFDRAVVPLGRMDRRADEVPVTIEPAAACEWRWLDPQALACQLPEDAPLREATRYTVTVRPEFVTEHGETLARGLEHEFVTQRPALRYAQVSSWAAPTIPVLRLYFSQPVSAASVAASLRVGGREIEARPDVHDRSTPYWLPGEAGGAGSEARRTWFVQPKTALPADRDAALRIMPGLRSAFGDERGIERRETARLHTFPALAFLGLRCTVAGGGGDVILIEPGKAQARLCDPLAPAALVFSAPVRASAVRQHVTITPHPAGGRKDYDPWANAPDRIYWSANAQGTDQRVFLPFTLKADAEYRLAGGADLEDAFGRRLGKAIDLAFRTAHRSATISFEHTTSVLEQGVDSDVPVIVTNLQRMLASGTATTADGSRADAGAVVPVAQAGDIAFAMPLGVRSLLGSKPGVFDGWLRTDPKTAGNDQNDGRGQHFFAEVTPWQLHVKLGHYNTLVWITEFATGRPVAGAEVELYAAEPRSWQPAGQAERATSDAAGLAGLPGSATVDPKLEHVGYAPKTPLAVRVRKGADFALLPLSSEFNVDIYRASRYQVYAQRRPRDGHLRSWGTTAQGVYRAGDAIQYKVYVRNDANRALTAAPSGPYRLRVLDPADQVVHERGALQLSAFGAIDGEFTVPKQGKVGWYRFELLPEFAAENAPAGEADASGDGEDEYGGTRRLEPLRVLVSDFTPAPFRLTTELRAKRALPGQTVTAVLQASLHAGGAFAGAPASLSARLVASAFESDDPVVSTFTFGSVDAGDSARDQRQIAEKKASTDASGEFSAELTPPESDIAWGRLVVEGGVQDDRGRAIAATASLPYAGRDRLVGLRAKDWLLSQGKRTSIETLVVDTEGRPVAGSPVYVKVTRREVTVARIKDVGNAYVARYSEKWVDVQICKGRSTAAPVPCAFTPDTGGAYRITASTRDTRNRLHTSTTWLWASGKNSFLWEEPDDYGLELVPDRKRYKVGDTARFLVKNPYPGATALITTERYGVIDRRTQRLEGSAPVIEIGITPDLLPGFYLSVVVQSPRVASPPPEGDVDLGKPTFRMGYARVTVDDPLKRIAVEVKADRERYKPRETAHVSVSAKPGIAAGAQKIEFAVAVVDEAVYDLIQGGVDYFDPYKGFNALDPLDLANYSLLTRLVGRQKFEKKGATPGGDGGADLSLRSVDKFVAYWNPALAADAQGHAEFSFTLPDNLTAWKLLVLAATPADQLGLGSGRLLASRDTELRPLMPTQVTSGDTFKAGFSVLNRAERTRTLTVTLEAKGAATAKTEQTLTLKPFERRSLQFEVAPQLADNAPGTIDFTATAADAQDRDALKLALPVRPRRPTVTAADFGFLDASGLHEQALLVPANSLPGGAISVSFAPSVLGNLDGAFKHLRDYPYLCWEQRLTKGVMAANYLRLRPWLDPKLAWPGAEAVVPRTLADAAAFQAADGGMTFWDGDVAHVSPYLSAYTALAFEWLRAAGHAPPEAVQTKLDGYLERLLRRDVPDWSLEASSAVRAVALSALASRGRLKPEDLARYAPSAPRMGLFGQALFLQAALSTPGAEAEATRTLGLVLAHGQQSAGTLVLKETDDSFWQLLLGSPLRSNCAALSALVSLPKDKLDNDASLAELPARLVRAITQARGGRDHWENTQENVFCTSALEAYARRYESATPNFVMRAALDAQPLGEAKFSTVRDAPVTLAHPIVAADIGVKRELTITQEGQGRGYFAARVAYVERDADAKTVNAGLQIRRRYAVKRNGAWQPLESPMRIARGELVRVELSLSTPSARSFLVVDDPVPGGLEPVNPDLATASGLAAEEAVPPGSADPYPFYHRELRFEAARWFADQVEAGTYRLYWIGQAVATGEFAVPATHAEAMYDPDIFGNDVPARLFIDEAQPAPTTPGAR